MTKFAIAFLWAAALSAQVIPGRYIVELTGDPAAVLAARKGSRSALAAGRSAVVAEQARVRRSLAGTGAEILDSVTAVSNAFIIRAPESDLAALEALPGVRKVHKVYRATLHMDHALNVAHVQEGWEVNGGYDTAGAGIKVGVIDTGLDPTHQGFRDDSLSPPDGYPIYSGKDDADFHELKKVIVARSYGAILGGTDTGPRDLDGHGSGTSLCATGGLAFGPMATIAGSAPKAFLGVYRLDPDLSTAAILKAFDDAVLDGMDVVNVSVGISLPMKPAIDPLYDAVERAIAAGVVVVSAAGNSGPLPGTVGPPGSSPNTITVGMSWNERIFASAVTVENNSYIARPGNYGYPDETVTGPLSDVTVFDPTGEACSALPADSLQGSIAVILRGTCTFAEKLQIAADAGAIGAIVYAREEAPDLFSMSVGTVSLPAMSVANADGVALLQLMTAEPRTATLRLAAGPAPVNPLRIATNSSRGPSPEAMIKPELLAPGYTIYTAAQTANAGGGSYSSTGYIQTAGTSFSSPIVAGMMALVKQARPGLTVSQYRSLMINSAVPIYGTDGKPLRVQDQGAGMANGYNATRTTILAEPATLSFGTATGFASIGLPLTITNLGTTGDVFSITVQPRDDGPAPFVSANTVELEAGSSKTINVQLTAMDLLPGESQGYLVIQGTQSEIVARVPYWFAVPGAVSNIPVLLSTASTPMAGSADTYYFQVLDANGVGLPEAAPVVSAVTEGAAVSAVLSRETYFPGGYRVDVRYAAKWGINTFTIKAGDITKTFSVYAY
jgi:subtilisin family serine protease